MKSIGAIASVKNYGFGSDSRAYNEDFEQAVANPDEMYEGSLPVGINETFMPTEKGDINSGDTENLDKAQHNIRDRFSYLPEDDR